MFDALPPPPTCGASGACTGVAIGPPSNPRMPLTDLKQRSRPIGQPIPLSAPPLDRPSNHPARAHTDPHAGSEPSSPLRLHDTGVAPRLPHGQLQPRFRRRRRRPHLLLQRASSSPAASASAAAAVPRACASTSASRGTVPCPPPPPPPSQSHERKQRKGLSESRPDRNRPGTIDSEAQAATTKIKSGPSLPKQWGARSDKSGRRPAPWRPCRAATRICKN
jgi:hypothetical protein